MIKFLNQRQASVSIFLLIIMLPMFVFSFGIIDICKIMMAEDVMQDASDLAAGSALTAYDKTLKDIYGLMATSSTEAELTEKIQQYYVTTLEASGVSLSKDDKQFVQNLLRDLLDTDIDTDALKSSQNLLNVRSEKTDGNAITVTPVAASAISNPAVMKRQIIEYSKYRGPVQLASGMLEKLGVLSDTGNQAAATEKKLDFEKKLSDVGSTAQELYTLLRIYLYNSARLECMCEYYHTPHETHPAFKKLYTGTNSEKAEQTAVNGYAITGKYKLSNNDEQDSRSASLARSLSSYTIDDHLTDYSGQAASALELLVICYPFYTSSGKLRSSSVISAGDIPSSPEKLNEKLTELTNYGSALYNAFPIAEKAQADKIGQLWYDDITSADLNDQKMQSAKKKLDLLNLYLPMYNSQFSDSGICPGFAQDLVTFRKCYEKAEKLTDKFDEKDKDYNALVSLSGTLMDENVKKAYKLVKYQEKIENSIGMLKLTAESRFNSYSGEILQIYYELYQQYMLIDAIISNGTLDKLYSDLEKAKTAASDYKSSVGSVSTDSIRTSMSSQCDSETKTLVDLSPADKEQIVSMLTERKQQYENWIKYIRRIYAFNCSFVNKAMNISSVSSAQNGRTDISKYLLTAKDMYGQVINFSKQQGNYRLSGAFNYSQFIISKPSVPGVSIKRWTDGDDGLQKNNLFIKIKEMAEPAQDTNKDETAKNKVKELGETKTDENGNTVSSKNSQPDTDSSKGSGSSSGSSGSGSGGSGGEQKDLPDFYELAKEIKSFDEFYAGQQQNSGSESQTGSAGTLNANDKDDKNVSKGAKDSLAAVGKQLAKLAEAARDDLLLTEYMTSQFSCHTTDLKDGKKNTDKKTMETTMTGMLYPESSSLYKCEVEYILYGQDSNLKNVAAASAIIFGIRFVLDLIYSFTDSEIRAFTLSAATAAGGIFPFSIPLIQTVIHIGLSIAEAGYDVEELLNGYTLPIFKTNDTWVFKPSGLAKKAAEKTLTALVDTGIDAASDGAVKLIDQLKNSADGKIDETSKEFTDYVDKQAKDMKSRIESDIKQPVMDKIQQLMLTARDTADSAKAKLKTDLKAELRELKTGLYDSLGLGGDSDRDLLKRAEKSVLDLLNTDEIAENAVNKLDELISAATGAPSSAEDWSAATQKLQNKLDELVFKKLNSLIDEAVTSIKEAGDGLKERTKTTLVSLADKAKEGTLNGADELKNALNDEISSAFSGSTSKVSLKKDTQKGFTKSSKLSNLLSMNYKDYLYVFMLIGFCTPAESDMLSRAAKVMEVNCRKGGAGDSYTLNSAATLISTEASASVRTLFYGAAFKDGKVDFSGKPDRYIFSCSSYAGY